MSGRVLVVGSANVDVVLRVDRLPAARARPALAADSVRGFGGKGANQAVAAAAAGARARSSAGSATTRRARRTGPGWRPSGSMSRTCSHPRPPTGTAYVLVDRDGENSIVVDPGPGQP